jgi:ketosteroid isomerase-like protein
MMNKKIILDFVDSINSADVDTICNLMTVDHVFVDSQDNKTIGRENMRDAWIGYFRLFPDYKIEIDEVIETDLFVGIFGYASATYKGTKNSDNNNYWRIPAAWKAIIKDNQISYWQVYADNSLPISIISKNN